MTPHLHHALPADAPVRGAEHDEAVEEGGARDGQVVECVVEAALQIGRRGGEHARVCRDPPVCEPIACARSVTCLSACHALQPAGALHARRHAGGGIVEVRRGLGAADGHAAIAAAAGRDAVRRDGGPVLRDAAVALPAVEAGIGMAERARCRKRALADTDAAAAVHLALAATRLVLVYLRADVGSAALQAYDAFAKERTCASQRGVTDSPKPKTLESGLVTITRTFALDIWLLGE